MQCNFKTPKINAFHVHLTVPSTHTSSSLAQHRSRTQLGPKHTVPERTGDTEAVLIILKVVF
jgi:hypothetical protein